MVDMGVKWMTSEDVKRQGAKMTTQEETKPNNESLGVDAKVMEEYDYWMKMERVTQCVVLFVFNCLLILTALAWSCFAIGGNVFKPADLSFLALFFLGLVCPLANVKPAKPVRIVREAILLFAGVLVPFLLSCMALYLFWDDTCGCDVWIAYLSKMCVGVSLGLVGIAIFLYLAFKCDRRRFVRKGAAYRERRMKRLRNWPARKVEAFLRKHPSIAVGGLKEFAFLWARYAIWMVLPVVSAFTVITALNSYDKKPLKYLSFDSSFEIDSFAGEKFGRVLSGDVERKKLSVPIGVIDELMLETLGDPKRRLVYIYGQKYIKNASVEDANRLAEEVCAAFQRLCGFGLYHASPQGRKKFCRRLFSNKVYAEVKWKDHFFQQGKVLSISVGLNRKWHCDTDLKVTEVMGCKIGEPVSSDEKPRAPFWKFERVVGRSDGGNNVADCIYAVHDISNLSLDDAIKELEDARKAVERLHGITMYKCGDYDDDKWYCFWGDDVFVSVAMEYMDKKQIRYCVRAVGDRALNVHALPAADR